ncbi:MAG: hypothetical protein IPP32_12750 [Bacteroidetes bacterium]|nr:hypothetical protein [Bacteroidota bacterium]
MANEIILNAKKQFVAYIEKSFNINPNYRVDYLVNNFLFDSITLLRDIKVDGFDKNLLLDYSSKNKKQEDFVKAALVEFTTQLYKSRAKTALRYTIPADELNSVDDIFLGLEFSGNNDTSYSNLPSALSLATFNV